jgi:short-subunit dehydrogenase
MLSNGLLAVVTGASSGIGAAFARQLAARGYDLLLVARREDRLRALAADIASAHAIQIETMSADLASDEGRDRLAARIRAASNLGLLVNNAGFGTVGLFHHASLEQQDQMHRLHVLTTLALSHAALENLTAREETSGGRGIINVSSVASFGQSPSNINYCATKAWMTTFTEGMAIELVVKRSPLRVQALCPGFTYSEFHDRIGMDRNPIPKQLWMTADFVVAESLRGFERGQVVVIPGWRYKIIVAFIKAMPGPLMRRISAVAAQRFRRPVAVKPGA